MQNQSNQFPLAAIRQISLGIIVPFFLSILAILLLASNTAASHSFETVYFFIFLLYTPSLVRFILLAMGLSKVSDWNGYFNNARKVVYVKFVFVLGMILSVSFAGNTVFFVLSFLMPIATILLQYFFCKGFEQFYQDRENQENAVKIMRLFYLSIMVGILSYVAVPFISWAASVANLAIFFLFLMMLQQLKRSPVIEN